MRCTGCFQEKCKVTNSYRLDTTEYKKIQSCNGCLKHFSKQHKECFKKFCYICQIFLNSDKDYKYHIEKYHNSLICKYCNQCFLYIDKHNENYHSI